MARANFQPFSTKKGDTPALIPSPIALPNHHMSGKVKVKITPMTVWHCKVQPTTVGMLPVDIYGPSPMDKLLINKTTTMPSRSEITILSDRQIPTEPPAQPIPLKPLDHVGSDCIPGKVSLAVKNPSQGKETYCTPHTRKWKMDEKVKTASNYNKIFQGFPTQQPH